MHRSRSPRRKAPARPLERVLAGLGTLALVAAGTLGGLSGAEAARAADITRPAPAGSLADYRVNACVIGSINCVVTPRFQPIPPTVRSQVDFTFRQNAFNPADVIIPNTGENDYE